MGRKQQKINQLICAAVISAVNKVISNDKEGFVFEDNKISRTEFKEALEYTISKLSDLPLDLHEFNYKKVIK